MRIKFRCINNDGYYDLTVGKVYEGEYLYVSSQVFITNLVNDRGVGNKDIYCQHQDIFVELIKERQDKFNKLLEP